MPRTIFDNIVCIREEEVMSIGYCQYTPIRFFEILWIEKGTGTLNINGHQVPYKKNQLFVLVPNDEYNFDIATPTTACAIKFIKNLFMRSSEEKDQHKQWFKRVETILHNSNRMAHVSVNSGKDEISLQALFQIFCNEYHDKQLKNETILKNTLHSILLIITRNIGFTAKNAEESKIQELVNYIHQHIHDAEKLSKKALAKTFFLSENYIGQYFKKQMGVGLKQYILNYKLSLAETRLIYTDLTFTEIAHELGFTDSSHLDKTFSAYKGITPSKFRIERKN